MSEDRNRPGDGLVIGILVVLVFLVAGGLGLGWYRIQLVRAQYERVILEAERARRAEEQARWEALKAQENASQVAPTIVPASSPPNDDTEAHSVTQPAKDKPNDE